MAISERMSYAGPQLSLTGGIFTHRLREVKKASDVAEIPAVIGISYEHTYQHAL